MAECTGIANMPNTMLMQSQSRPQIHCQIALPHPTRVTDVREVTDMFNYIRLHIPDFVDITHTIVHLMKGGLPSSSKIDWSAEVDEAFMLLKQAMASSSVLAHPDLNHFQAYSSDTQYLCHLSDQDQKPIDL